MTSAPMAHDDNIATDNETSSIRVGSVLGESNMKLEIAAGPSFADVLHSDKRTVSLLSGTRVVLGTKAMIPDDMQLHFHAAGQEP